MNIKVIQELIKKEIDIVNDIIYTSIFQNLNINIINNTNDYLFNKLGKQIRPLILILIDKINNNCTNINCLKIAAAIELIHMATILHDDVIDNETKRRNKTTINKKWCNKTAILIGDYLYSKAFQIMMETKNIEILDLMAKSTNIISQGEILQLSEQYNITMTKKKYFKIIKYKTSQLFYACTITPAIINKENYNIKKIYSSYGMHIGNLYQLTDDILDYQTTNTIGKTSFNDLKEHKITLPLLYIIKNGNDYEKNIIKNFLKKKNNSIEEIQKIVLQSNAINYSKNIAIDEAKKAINCIKKLKKSNIYTEILINIINQITDKLIII